MARRTAHDGHSRPAGERSWIRSHRSWSSQYTSGYSRPQSSQCSKALIGSSLGISGLSAPTLPRRGRYSAPLAEAVETDRPNVLAYSRWRASSQQPPYRSQMQSAMGDLRRGRGAGGCAGTGSRSHARFPLRKIPVRIGSGTDRDHSVRVEVTEVVPGHVPDRRAAGGEGLLDAEDAVRAADLPGGHPTLLSAVPWRPL